MPLSGSLRLVQQLPLLLHVPLQRSVECSADANGRNDTNGTVPAELVHNPTATEVWQAAAALMASRHLMRDLKTTVHGWSLQWHPRAKSSSRGDAAFYAPFNVTTAASTGEREVLPATPIRSLVALKRALLWRYPRPSSSDLQRVSRRGVRVM